MFVEEPRLWFLERKSPKGGTFQSKDQAFDEAKILLTSLPWPTSPAVLATFNVS